jgi:hypothetical protein
VPISRVGFTSTGPPGASSTTITPVLPAGTASGDFAIVSATFSRTGTLWALSSYPGWILQQDTVDGSIFTRILTRVLDGTSADNPPTFTNDGTAAANVGTCVVYRGVDNTTPLITQALRLHTEASNVAHPASAITNNDSGAWGIYLGTARQVATPLTWTPGTGLTEIIDRDSTNGTTNNCAVIHADTNGSVGTGAVTYTASTSAATASAIMGAAFLKPAAGVSNLDKLRIGNSIPTAIKIGTETVSKVYLGSVQIWP